MAGGLVLCSMSDAVRTALEVAGFAKRLTTTSSQAEAIQRVSVGETEERVRDLALELLVKGEKRSAKGK